jgi:hypothetical protein
MPLVLRLAFIFTACWHIFDFLMVILLGISLPLALIFHNYVYFFIFYQGFIHFSWRLAYLALLEDFVNSLLGFFIFF